jgi:hypothetical protein
MRKLDIEPKKVGKNRTANICIWESRKNSTIDVIILMIFFKLLIY